MADKTPWSGAVQLEQLSEELSRLRLMSESSQREMETSLCRHGQLTSLIGCRSEKGLVVVDGFKRLRAARNLGWTELRVEVHDAHGVAAKMFLWQSNQSEGLSELEQAWVIRSLYREERLTQPQIAHLLSRHKSWVCRRLLLAEGLAEGVEADLRLGLLSATAARELARLPRGNQQEHAAQVVTRRGLTSRQTAKLVDQLLLASDEREQLQILAKVLDDSGDSEFNRATKSARLAPAEQLIADVVALKRISSRLNSRLLERSLESLGEEVAVVALRSIEELRPGLMSLCRTIDKLVGEKVVNHVMAS